ncbi:MAG: tetratricopeptide repeat protein, partial [Chloroflexota bacterium]
MDKSLLSRQVSDGDETPRFGMLETIREYALEQLESCGEGPELRGRHLDWRLALAEKAEAELFGPAADAWLARLEREHDNLRAALGEAQARGQTELGLRLAIAAHRFWEIHGHQREGRAVLERLLAADSPSIARRVRMKALRAAGWLSVSLGDLDRAETPLMAGYALAVALDDQPFRLGLLSNLAWLAYWQRDLDRAGARCHEALALAREAGNNQEYAYLLMCQGHIVAQAENDLGHTMELYSESLAHFRRQGDQYGAAIALDNLGDKAVLLGAYETASTYYQEALVIERTLGNVSGISGLPHSLLGLGDVALEQGNYEQAMALYEESLGLSR